MTEPLLTSWQDCPDIKSTQPLATGQGVIDQSAFDTIEVDNVFDAVNHASTTIGQAVLFRSLTQPLNTIDAIKAKQQAVEELRANPALIEALDAIMQTAASHEKNFYLLLFGKFLGSFGTARGEHEIEGYGYHQYKRGVRFMLGVQR
jgi:DNA mismatch repair protein MutS